jgi:peptidoglycan/LPS O-acetylase OafA/YrhL
LRSEKLSSFVDNQTVQAVVQPVTEVKPAVISRKPRIANIERLRFLSAFGVAAFHTHLWFPRSLGLAGFVILLLIFCAFVVNKPEPYDLATVAARKARRLLKPWLFWSIIYAALALAKMVYQHLSFSDVFSPTMLLTGTRIHLWFLPFAFVAAIVLTLIHRKVASVPESLKIATAIAIGALCVFGCSVIQSRLQPPTPLAQWTLGLPAIPLGFAVGRIQILQRKEDRKKYSVLTILATMAAFVACVMLALFSHGTWFDYGTKLAARHFVSVVLVFCAFHWRGKLDSVSASLASLSYGVYLIHPLVVVPFHQSGIAEQHPLVLLFFVLSISLLITLILQKTPLKRFV